MLEEYCSEARREETAPRIGQPAERIAHKPGDGHGDNRPDVVRARVEADDGIAYEVAAVDVDVGAGVVEHPSDVRVEKALERSLTVAVAIDKRAVVVAAVVSVG